MDCIWDYICIGCVQRRMGQGMEVIGGIPRVFAPVKLHRSSRTLIPRSIWNDNAIRLFPSARSAKWKPAHRKHNRTRRATDPLCGLRAKRILENTQRFALFLRRQGYLKQGTARSVIRRRTKCASLRSWRLPKTSPILRTSTVGSAASVLRTASGIPDDRSPPVLCVPDVEHVSRHLAPAVLSGGWFSLVPQRSGSKSVLLPLLGGATSVASQKGPCSIASFPKTWRPSSSKRRTATPAASFLASSAPSLSATCAAGCSATALPVFAVRRANGVAAKRSSTLFDPFRPLAQRFCLRLLHSHHRLRCLHQQRSRGPRFGAARAVHANRTAVRVPPASVHSSPQPPSPPDTRVHAAALRADW